MSKNSAKQSQTWKTINCWTSPPGNASPERVKNCKANKMFYFLFASFKYFWCETFLLILFCHCFRFLIIFVQGYFSGITGIVMFIKTGRGGPHSRVICLFSSLQSPSYPYTPLVINIPIMKKSADKKILWARNTGPDVSSYPYMVYNCANIEDICL